MANAKISYIKKPANGSHEHITHVGSNSWEWSVEEVIKSIENETNTFYVEDTNGKQSYVGVVRPSNHVPYIRTYANESWNDNLLSLPRR